MSRIERALGPVAAAAGLGVGAALLAAVPPVVAAQTPTAAVTPLPAAAAPAPRDAPELARAPGRTETTLLFGGTDGHDLSDTWTFDGVWHEHHLLDHPSGRAIAAIAYDPISDTSVMFGGLSGGVSTLDDTWVWNGDTWRRATPTTHPSRRAGSVMAFDTSTGRLLLFGGQEYLGNAFDETWAWTGSDWQLLNPVTRPPAGSRLSLMTDTAGVVAYDRVSGDAWTWAGVDWVRHLRADTFTPGDEPPTGGIATLAAGRLFAGTRQYDQLWEWGGGVWSHSRPATSSRAPSGPVADTLIAFSGTLRSAERNDTWWLDADGRWQQSATPFYAVPPQRVLDTRPDGQFGYLGAKPGAGDVVKLELEQPRLPGGNDGVHLADGATAVLQVTATEATADGFITVADCAPTPPLASNLNVSAGETVSALVFAHLGAHASTCLYTQSGAHLLADLVGYVPTTSGFSGGEPVRVLDTRPTGSIGYGGAKPGAGSLVHAPTGRPGDTVVLNITGTEPSADGYVSVVPCEAPTLPPATSDLNLARGETRANLVITAADGNGDVCLYTQSGTHLVVDRAGDFGRLQLRGSIMRAIDTRLSAPDGTPRTKPGPGDTLTIAMPPSVVPVSTTALLLHVTATEATEDGFVTAWACDDGERPLASVLNLTRGSTRTNTVLVPIGPSRTVCLFTQSGAHLVVDVLGAL